MGTLLNRRRYMGCGQWENPYVTDGLVAMFDADWNAGWNVHTDNLGGITELVSGTFVSLGTGYTIGSNYIDIVANTSTQTGVMIPFVTQQVYTLESCGCVLSKPTAPTYSSGMFSVNGFALFMNRSDLGGATGIVGCYAVLTDGKTHFYGSPSNINTAKNEADAGPWGVSRTRSAYVGNRISVNDIALYVNGVEHGGKNTMSYTTTGATSAAGILLPVSNSATTRFHRIAIYNKKLSTSEIIQNYLADKERFNL